VAQPVGADRPQRRRQPAVARRDADLAARGRARAQGDADASLLRGVDRGDRDEPVEVQLEDEVAADLQQPRRRDLRARRRWRALLRGGERRRRKRGEEAQRRDERAARKQTPPTPVSRRPWPAG
jgi:hypothetical protein